MNLLKKLLGKKKKANEIKNVPKAKATGNRQLGALRDIVMNTPGVEAQLKLLGARGKNPLGPKAQKEAKFAEQPTAKKAKQDIGTKDGKRFSVDGARYKKGKRLGHGMMGEVHRLDSRKKGGAPLVMKTSIDCFNQHSEQYLRDEAKVLDKVGTHANIVDFIGEVDLGNDKHGLILEHVGGGDLKQGFKELEEMEASGAISYTDYIGTIQYLIKGLMQGLAHLEKAGVTHQDLKLDNVLLDDKTLQPKIADFGVATGVHGCQDKKGWGNAKNKAPEVVQGKTETKSDVFSTSAMLFNLREGNDHGARNVDEKLASRPQEIRRLMYAEDENATALGPMSKEQKAKGKKVFGKYAAKTAYVDFINRTMTPTADKRLSPEEALKEAFLADPMLSDDEAQEILQRMFDARNDKKSGKAKDTSKKKRTKKAPKIKSVIDKVRTKAMKDAGLGFFDRKKAIKEHKQGRSSLLEEIRKFDKKTLEKHP